MDIPYFKASWKYFFLFFPADSCSRCFYCFYSRLDRTKWTHLTCQNTVCWSCDYFRYTIDILLLFPYKKYCNTLTIYSHWCSINKKYYTLGHLVFLHCNLHYILIHIRRYWLKQYIATILTSLAPGTFGSGFLLWYQVLQIRQILK